MPNRATYTFLLNLSLVACASQAMAQTVVQLPGGGAGTQVLLSSGIESQPQQVVETTTAQVTQSAESKPPVPTVTKVAKVEAAANNPDVRPVLVEQKQRALQRGDKPAQRQAQTRAPRDRPNLPKPPAARAPSRPQPPARPGPQDRAGPKGPGQDSPAARRPDRAPGKPQGGRPNAVQNDRREFDFHVKRLNGTPNQERDHAGKPGVGQRDDHATRVVREDRQIRVEVHTTDKPQNDRLVKQMSSVDELMQLDVVKQLLGLTRENVELAAKMKVAEVENKLNRRIQELEIEKRNLELRFQEQGLQRAERELEQRNRELRDHERNLERHSHEMGSDGEALEQELRKRDQVISQLKEALEQKERQLVLAARSKSDQASIRKNHAGLEQKLKATMEKLAATAKENHALQSKLRGLAESHKKSLEEAEGLANRKTEMEHRVRAMQAEMKAKMEAIEKKHSKEHEGESKKRKDESKKKREKSSPDKD